MSESLVVLRNVAKTYQQGIAGVTALGMASCEIRSGDRVAVIGASGSGKSTLLRIMGGLERPSRGTVLWPALAPSRSKRPYRTGFVFQNESLLPSLSIVENVAVPLTLQNADGAREAALAVLESLDLSAIADKLPEEVSGGQAQQAAMARAIVARPRLVLADEPTGQLDGATGQRLLDVLLASLDPSDSALVVATHDPSVADRMHAVWHIRHGMLQLPDTEAVA